MALMRRRRYVVRPYPSEQDPWYVKDQRTGLVVSTYRTRAIAASRARAFEREAARAVR